MTPLTDKPPCVECGKPTDPFFHHESGGLCGDCLADCAFLPLTRIEPRS